MNSAGKSNSSSPAEEEIIQTSNTTVIDENEDFVLANEILVTDADDEFEKIWKDTMEEDQKSLIKLKESQSFVDLPHALGSLPSYLVASKVSRAPKSPSSLSLGLYEYSDDKLDYLKKQVLHLSNQARESNEKAFRLTKIIDQFRQSSYDVRRELRASELKISEQDGKIKVLRQKLKSLSDKIEQVSKLESRVAYLSKLNDGFSRDNKTKDESIQKLTIENRRLRSEIEAKKKIIEAAKNEKAALKKSSESFQRHKQTFEVELDSRDVQIDILRAKISKLELENNELKIELNEVNDKVGSIGGGGDGDSTLGDSREIIKSLKSKLANYEIMIISKMAKLKGEFEMLVVDDGKSLKSSEILLKVKGVSDEEEY